MELVMERDQQIILMRLLGFNLNQVAKEFGLTRLEVRRIESNWLKNKTTKSELGVNNV
jgi:DNA-directed RNA polymerase sigma subunit (sigma70/sigma32)